MWMNHKFSRRDFLISGTTLFASLSLKVYGEDQNSFSSYDKEIENFIKERRIPGATLAVFNKAKIIYTRGYGYANIQEKIKPEPPTLFRIASLSKSVTATGILKLFEDGKIDIDSPAIEYLKNLDIDKNIADNRWYKISVKNLLQHTGGWDLNKSGDPMFYYPAKFVQKTNRSIKPIDVIEYMLGKPLDFDPGSKYVYSNFGYCVLGRVIEAVSGLNYEDYIIRYILRPAGINDMHIGSTKYSKKRKNEATYYTAFNNAQMADLPNDKKENEDPYGSFNIEIMDSHGGWIASAVEFARFCQTFSEYSLINILKPSTINKIIEPPSHLSGKNHEVYYGLGWLVRPKGVNGKPNLWHSGSLPGSYSFAVILGDSRGWVALFNGRSADNKNYPNDAIDAALHRAASKVKQFSD
jgi:N-acyl-D-amino-acid deacylase